MPRILDAPPSAATSVALIGSGSNGPGSNGYRRRAVYRRPGTHVFTALTSGNILIQALGACPGASGGTPGPSSPFGERKVAVLAGQQITVEIGAGGAGSAQTSAATAGGATTVSGPPIGGTPLIITGGVAPNKNASVTGTPGSATGPWDLVAAGAAVASVDRPGGPSSGSPFGPGLGPSSTSAQGGCGWGGPSNSGSGASSHRHGRLDGEGAAAETANGGSTAYVQPPESLPFWDMRSVDSGGAGAGGSLTTSGQDAGPGAGGGSGERGGTSALGGGTGASSSSGGAAALKSGHGVGGGAATNSSVSVGGIGGDGIVFIFFDEVA